MRKTRTNSSKQPRGITKPQSPERQKQHLDTMIPLLAHEHYGRYLIVQNTKSDTYNHNRLYLCHKSQVEFLKEQRIKNSHIIEQRGSSPIHILTRFETEFPWLQREIFELFNETYSRGFAHPKIAGLAFFLDILRQKAIYINSFQELHAEHINTITRHVQNSTYSTTILKHTTKALNHIKSKYQKNYKVPPLKIYGKIQKKDNEISTALLYQMDHYACKELDETIRLRKEYEMWIQELKAMQENFTQEELDIHGGLFTRKNLIFTYFENIELIQNSGGSTNSIIRKIAKNLYDFELKCYERLEPASKETKNAIEVLKEEGLGGINISITDERMFALWHKILVPHYPIETKILPQFHFIHTSIRGWQRYMSNKKFINRARFNRRNHVNFQNLYPLYLFSLIRSGLNQDCIKDWRIYKDSGTYKTGEESGLGRIMDGYKGRGNSMQFTSLDEEHCRYIDFFCKFGHELYEHSKDDHLFQYFYFAKDFDRFQVINHARIGQMKKSSNFYDRNTITDIRFLVNGEREEVRILHIDHTKIRSAENLSQYLKGKKEWERQLELGHLHSQTGRFYEQDAQFKHIKNHRIAKTLNKVVAMASGEISEEVDPKVKIFKQTPLSNCQDPFHPDYKGAKAIREGDACSNWRKCLGCFQSKIVKEVHAANIMSWKIVMQEVRLIYPSIEEWERHFFHDYQVAEAALSSLNIDYQEKLIYEQKANEPGRIEFMRKEVLSAQNVRKLEINNEDVE
jgi:hypothetical protein